MRRWAAALAVGLLALLACAPPGAPSPEAAATGHPSAAGPAPGSIQAFIPQAERFVERERGLTFKTAVKVTFLAGADFQKRIEERDLGTPTERDRDARFLRALHLVDPGVDLVKAQIRLLDAGVVGFYDPKTKELVVRGVDASPATRHVLVHELTHALQDQYFPLDNPAADSGGEQGDAFRAVVEGDAVRVEVAYLRSLPPAEQRQALAAAGAGAIPSDVPHSLVEILEFPYVVGPRFVDAMLRDGGQARLDDAFRHQPATTTEVIHPERYLQRFKPADLSRPPAGGPVFDTGTLGEFGLSLLVERLPAAALGSAEGAQLVTGWRGDRYVAYQSGARACVRDAIVLDTPQATARLAGAFTHAAGEIAVQPDMPAVLTFCG